MRKNIVLLMMMVVSLPAISQRVISFQTDFGLVSKIDYEGKGLDQKDKLGFNVGINYTHFIKTTFAIESGIGISSYATDITLPSSYQFVSNEVDSQGSGFEFRATTNGYKEEHQLLMLAIPLRVRFEGPSKESNTSFYASAGVKFLLPISQKNNISANSLTTKGYYPNHKLLIENVAVHGFSTFKNVNTSLGSIYKSSLALTAELGVGITLKSYKFYVGAYLDYGLTDIRKKSSSDDSFISYTGSNSTKVNGIAMNKYIDNAKLFSTGIQLRFPIYSIKK